MTRHKVVSTKKLEPSLIEMAKNERIDILEQEAIQVKPILTKEKWDEIYSLLERPVKYAVFTSSNAVAAVKKYINTYVNHLPTGWKIFCLSGKTKSLLMEDEKIFGTVEETAPNATELAEAIIRKKVNEVLFFCGNKRRDELPFLLKAGGVQVHEVVVYETIETPIATEDDVDGILFFSPSAVQSFFAVNQLKENTVCFAIGQTTAESLSGFVQSKILISNEPTPEALLKEAINYFNK